MRTRALVLFAVVAFAPPVWLPTAPAAAVTAHHVQDAAWYWSVIDSTGESTSGALSALAGVPAGDLAVGASNHPDKASALLLDRGAFGLGQNPERLTGFVAAFTLDPAATQIAPATTSIRACPLLAQVVNSTSAQPMAALPDHGARCVTGTWSADKTQVLFDLRSTATGWLDGDALPGLVLTLPATVSTPTQDVFLREPTLTLTTTSPPAATQLPATVTTPPVPHRPAGVVLSAVTSSGSAPITLAPTVAAPQLEPTTTSAQALPRAQAAAATRPFSRAAAVIAGLFALALLGCCALSWQGRALGPGNP
jgi:hypothetical protein